MTNHLIFIFITGCLIIVSISIAQQNSKDVSSEEIEFFDEIKSPSPWGEVTFTHLEHSEDFEFECEECHHEINATKLDIPHQEYFEDFWIDCRLCHYGSGPSGQKAQACSKCHHIQLTGIADETLSSKVVIHKLCWDCHETKKGSDASQQCKLCHTGQKKSF